MIPTSFVGRISLHQIHQLICTRIAENEYEDVYNFAEYEKESPLKARYHLSICFAVIVLLFTMPLSALAESAKVAVLPFAVHADKDYSFLQKGIVQMLTSRLSEPGKVTVIDPIATENALSAAQGLCGDALARQVGRQTGADLAINGSLTILGDSVSIDAKTIDITGSRQPITFFKQTQGLGNVIGQINLMAADINDRIFGVEKPVAATAAAAPAAVPTPAPPAVSAPVEPDVHMHPEKLLQQGRPLTTGTPTASPLVRAGVESQTSQTSSLNPAFIPARGSQARRGPGFWKSRNFKAMINGIDVGDVDNDGLLETVVAMPDKVMVLRFSQGRQQAVAEIKAESFVRNISVSIGDINGNGIPEIFVTALSVALDVVESSVLEFDGKKYQPILQGSHYYYNVISHPSLGARLFAQYQNGRSDPYNGAIFEMEWKGTDYEQIRKVLPPHKANVLGITIGNITDDQNETIAAFSPRDHLWVMDMNGKAEWKGNDPYGGSTLYFSSPPTDPLSDGEHSYLPTRLRAVDLDRDGKLEILTSKNSGSTGRKMDKQRYFKRSNIFGLIWDGLGLTPLWQTQEIAGRVQDLLVDDFDNDGKKELLAAVITKEGAIIFTEAHSALIAFELNTP